MARTMDHFSHDFIFSLIGTIAASERAHGSNLASESPALCHIMVTYECLRSTYI